MLSTKILSAATQKVRGARVSEEWIDDSQAGKLLAVLEIFSVEDAAVGFESGGYDEGVIPRELSFIHFVTSEFTASVDVAETAHQCAVGIDVTLGARIGFEPFAEGGVESLAFRLGNLAGQFNEVGVGAQGDVLHDSGVHDFRVHCKNPVITNLVRCQ